MSTGRSSAEEPSHGNVFAEPSGGPPRCGCFVTVHDLIWPEGGLCELEEERKPVEGRGLWEEEGKASARQAP